MDINLTLTAKPRTDIGKGPVGRLRRRGFIPAVFYGRNHEARSLMVAYKELKATLVDESGSQAILRLLIEGEAGVEEKTVTFKECQVHPIKRTVIHVDFQEVDLDRLLVHEVPLVLIGRPIALDRGGILQQVHHNLTVSALPKDLPEKIEVDISQMKLGSAVHVDQIKAPAGVTIVYEANYTLATLAAPRGPKPEAEGGEAGEAKAEPSKK